MIFHQSKVLAIFQTMLSDHYKTNNIYVQTFIHVIADIQIEEKSQTRESHLKP